MYSVGLVFYKGKWLVGWTCNLWITRFLYLKINIYPHY